MGHYMNRMIVLAALMPSLGSISYAAPVPPKLADVLEPLPPSAVKVGGFLGERVQNNEKNRLLVVDEDDLLAGFRKRPGRQAWIGEHVGKFLHAATLAWANTNDPKLREKIDRVAAELIKTQEADGYLGTYTPDKRFGLYPGADWDVWVHKYNLIGLLTHHEYTGNEASLTACRKMGDLLLNTFGPGKKSIIAAGTHVGMASTSILEPMVNLYRATGEERYLSFAKYLVQSWDEPGGPKIIKTLSETGKVNKTANGKAYEMMSNLVGLCELARATGDANYIEPAKKAWADVVANQRYITGTASHHEHFHADHELPHGNTANMGETCVTTTWIQLNWQLLRLTGEAKYGEEIERAYYNHLAGAQLPDGSKWCYYTPLEGTKPYGNSTNCCLSSGPRAMALLPQMTYFMGKDQAGKPAVFVNLKEDAQADFNWQGVRWFVIQKNDDLQLAPAKGTKLDASKKLDLMLRAQRYVRGNGIEFKPARKESVWLSKSFQELLGDSPKALRASQSALQIGTDTNAGRAALSYGPFVLAYDEKLNPDLPPAKIVTLAADAVAKPVGDLKYEAPIQIGKDGPIKNATFVPFAQAGATGGRFAVWLRAPGNFAPEDALALGRESRSREGNVNGSINDGDAATYVVTFDGEKQDEDWFAVNLEKPLMAGRIVFAHGQNFHDGGWFDASGGKPRVQVKKTNAGAWETIGTLDDYPATTATDNRGLQDGQKFTLKLPAPFSIVALRVIGKPASGDNANQAFSSCGELSAFEK